MKKIAFALAFAVASFMSTAANAAWPHIKIEYERGSKAKADEGCFGKGCCKFKVDIGFLMAYQGSVTKDNNGNLIMVLGNDYSNSFPGDFADGTFPVCELNFQPGQLEDLGISTALTIPEGIHPVQFDPALNSWYVSLQ